MTPERLTSLLNLFGAIPLALGAAALALATSRRVTWVPAKRALLGLCLIAGVGSLAEAAAEIVALTAWNVPVTVSVEQYREYRPGRFATSPHAHFQWGTMNPAWKQVSIDTNSDGLRTAVEPETAKAATERRVLVLGDSFVFGLGLDSAETVPFVLEKRLREKDGTAWRVVNAGVPGYNFFSELDLFEWTVDHYRPDVSVFMLQQDDLLPDLNDELRRLRRRKTSGLARFALYRLFKAGGNFVRYRSLLSEDVTGHVMVRQEIVDELAPELARAAARLDEIAARSKTSIVIAFLVESEERRTRTLAKNLGYGPLTESKVHFGVIPWDTHSTVDRIPGDGHPTPSGAEKIAGFLEGMVRRAAVDQAGP